jgi:dienelactone hydrolase
MLEPETTGTSRHIHAGPESSLIDGPLSVALHGFEPWEDVTLRASMQDDLRRLWACEAVFVADDRGTVDLSIQTPANRIYADADPRNLISCMELDLTGALAGPPVFIRALEQPLEITLSLHSATCHTEAVTLRRRFAAPEISISAVSDAGLTGILCKPAGSGPFPAVLCIGGAIGGPVWADRTAALLASHGYVALSLAYFGVGALPRELVEIPLEYLCGAFQWLGARSEVDRERVAIIGKSKGSEAALLLAARLERVAGVIAYVPTSVVYQGIQVEGIISSARSSWTWRNSPLPFVPCYAEGGRFAADTFSRLAELHTANLDNPWIVSRAGIEVERIRGDLLIFSAEADCVWPSTWHAGRILKRLEEHDWGGTVQHVAYTSAGHGFGLPYLPQQTFGGGTARGNAIADADSWRETLKFLDRRLSGSV